MPRHMILRVWDVAHGACAMLHHVDANGVPGRLAMIDSGCTDSWRPSRFIRYTMGRTVLDHLLITNADQDHMSDLQGLWDEGIAVKTFYRNRSYTGAQMQAIKIVGGDLTDDARRYIAACDYFMGPVTEPFDDHMGGIDCRAFWNNYPAFTDTNNLSFVVFIRYAGVTFLFPGDLEKEGWLKLLDRADFRFALQGVTVMIASHHGRESGFCPEVFEVCNPQCVVISDKPIQHETQLMVPDYRNVVTQGVVVKTTGKHRHVLTTRRDGWIQFLVYDNGRYDIETEKIG